MFWFGSSWFSEDKLLIWKRLHGIVGEGGMPAKALRESEMGFILHPITDFGSYHMVYAVAYDI